MKRWNLRSILLSEATKPSAGLESQFAVILLNRPVDDITAEPIFDSIWSRACCRLCADGGANRLYDSISGNTERLHRLLPDEILGDLDSLRDDVRKFYQDKSVTVTKVHDQDTTDFQKCLLRLQDLEASLGLKQGSLVVLVFGAIGGRFDQTMSSINTLCQFKEREVYLLGSSNCISLLSEGSHEFILTKGMEGPHCGLIPMAGKSRMRTKGLKWDMQEDWVSEFGGLVSTSNLVDYQDDGDKDYILTVEIMEGVVVWTTEFSVKYFSTNPSNLLSN